MGWPVTGVPEVEAGDAGGVGEEIEEAELDAEEASEEPDGELFTGEKARGDAGELERLNGEHQEGCQKGGASRGNGEEAEEDVDHHGVEGVPEVLVEKDPTSMEEAGEDSGGDDGHEADCPGVTAERRGRGCHPFMVGVVGWQFGYSTTGESCVIL